MQPDRELRSAIVAALVASASMIGFQTAAKATRDALFLSTFEITALPTMVIGAALVSVLLTFYFARLMPVFGPGRLVSWAFGLSAALLLIEWVALGWVREPIVIFFYLHYAGLGALLISGFWSIVNERFDPRTAKREIGRIAAVGTAGGLAGGLLAERMAALVTVESMLPVLSGLHALAALALVGSNLRRSGRQTSVKQDRGGGELPSGLKTIVERPYLRNLVALVLLAAIAEMFIDYVFKARASAAAPDKESLLRFFAIVYTAIGLLTVVIQAAGTRFALQRIGLARTAAFLPVVSALGSVTALAVPGLPSATGARGAEIVARNSLFRAAYELLFTPLSPHDKRATKSLIDVGVVRLGDITGGVLVQGVLLLAAAAALPLMLGFAVGFSALALLFALRLHRGYVQTLESSLLSQAVRLDLSEIRDLTTRTAMLETIGALDLSVVRETPPSVTTTRGGRGTERRSAEVRELDSEMQRLVDLRSRDPSRVRAALQDGPLTMPMIHQAVALLAWNEVATAAVDALRSVGDRYVGQLQDHLLDPDEEFAVRRRIPSVLVAAPSARTVEVLFTGLRDTRFEVRYRCGRALSRILQRQLTLAVDHDRVFEAVLREVVVDRGVWESRRLLDTMDDEDWSPVVDEVVRERADRSLEHVFTLLGLALPREPLKVAFRGLHTDDRMLRGTSLEYLETALPEEVRMALWPFLDDDRRSRPPRRATKEILDELLGSNESIAINLERLRRKRDMGDA